VAHDRKFRFGVQILRASSTAELRETARRAEDLGYATAFMPDHFVDHPLAPMPALAAIAEATERLRVGTLVLGNDYKHPVVVASEAATIDLLSDGRLELGIGAGWMTADYEKAGIERDPPGVRIARLAESIAVIKGLMADGPFNFTGKHYRITELDGEPKPVQRPHPPIVVGGGGRKVLTLAAREADIVGINPNLRTGVATDPDNAKTINTYSVDEKLGWIRDAAGERFDALEIQAFAGFVHFTENAREVAEAMAPAFDTSPEQVLDAPVALVGTEEEMVDTLERRRDRWQMSYHVIPVESMEQFAPVVAQLAET
jgi:probable F420-dependent oxidoreductase